MHGRAELHGRGYFATCTFVRVGRGVTKRTITSRFVYASRYNLDDKRERK